MDRQRDRTPKSQSLIVGCIYKKWKIGVLPSHTPDMNKAIRRKRKSLENYTCTHTHNFLVIWKGYINIYIYLYLRIVLLRIRFDHVSSILGNHLLKNATVFLLFLPYLSRGEILRSPGGNIRIIIDVKVPVPWIVSQGSIHRDYISHDFTPGFAQYVLVIITKLVWISDCEEWSVSSLVKRNLSGLVDSNDVCLLQRAYVGNL